MTPQRRALGGDMPALVWRASGTGAFLVHPGGHATPRAIDELGRQWLLARVSASAAR
ncbi:MAG TPA: hypothetical protein VGK79_12185 [Gaiellaceae bacterium]